MQRLSFLVVAAFVAVFTASVRAHELPYDVVVYLTVDQAQLHVLARVPMPLLTDANLPLKNGYLDLAASGEPLRAVAFDLARNLDVMSAGRSLPSPSSLTWSVVRRVDTMSSAYDPAGAAGMPPGDAPLDPNVAGVVVKLEYSLPQPTAAELRLSVRVNGFRARARPVQTVVHYTNGSTVRTLTMTGTPRRVDLEPGWRVVAPLFARLGMERLTLGVEHLLFILCLAIPRRTLREVLAVLGASAGGFTVALAAAPLIALPPGPIQALLAAVLMIVALQNVTAPRLVWVGIGALAFGLCDGLSFGIAYREDLALAGAHALLSFVAFAGPVLVATLWLLILVRPLVAFIYRTPVPERWAIICLSAIPIHAGLHGIMALRGL